MSARSGKTSLTAPSPAPEAGDGAVIVCQDLGVAYGREEVLHGVCLRVPAGAFLPLVGPNGSGKSTLLKTIVGLVRPQRGSVSTNFHLAPPGYVPQQGAIDPLFPLSLGQVVAMGLYPRLGWWRRPSRQQREAVRQALARLNLEEHAGKTFGELSGGMRQKALIARALVAGPKVLVLDEPTAGLDESSQKEVLSHLARLCRQEGKTVLLAHHGEDLLRGLAGMVCEVNHGRARMRPLAGGDACV